MDRMVNSKFLNMSLDITQSFKWLHITAVNLNKMCTYLEQLTDWQDDQLTDIMITNTLYKQKYELKGIKILSLLKKKTT